MWLAAVTYGYSWFIVIYRDMKLYGRVVDVLDIRRCAVGRAPLPCYLTTADDGIFVPLTCQTGLCCCICLPELAATNDASRRVAPVDVTKWWGDSVAVRAKRRQ